MNRTLALALVGCLLVVARPAAHEIPNEVTVQTFLKPEGQTLVFLVRAPLKAMRDMDVPTLSNGFLDLSRMGPTLQDAATLWIGDFVDVYENGQLLPKAAVTAARVSLPSDKAFATYDEAVAEYMNAVLESEDPELLLLALSDVARARGMTQVAKDAGLGRESLYKALSPDGNPALSTVLNVVRALGLKLQVARLPR